MEHRISRTDKWYFGVIAYIQIPKEERVIWGLLVCLTDIIFGMLVLTFNGTMILSALLPLFFAVTFIIRGILHSSTAVILMH